MIREFNKPSFTSRFSNRAENYLKYRPAYPTEVLAFLEQSLGLKKTHHVADIGSGTGRFTELLLSNGYEVTAIEPNDDMRETATKKLARYPRFTALATNAEDTGLDSHCVDFITVAQAFHWIDPEAAREEFMRILKPGGKIALIWTFRSKVNPFLAAYDRLKKQHSLKNNPLFNEENIRALYHPASMQVQSFSHNMWMDFDGLKGLLLSSAGIPLPGEPGYDTMISSLVQLFVAHNQNGFVKMEYVTRVYSGC